MKRGRHPNSRANLRTPWRKGEAGNAEGGPKRRYHPSRVLLRLLRDGASDEAERILLRTFARGELGALDVVLCPPAPPGIVTEQGRALEPITMELPGTPG